MRKVGVIRGGAGGGYDLSLREGGDVILHILENLSERWKPVDIFIDKEGTWHLGGVKVEPAALMHKVDIVWNTSHPSVASMVESMSVPCVSASSFASAMSRNSESLDTHVRDIGLKSSKKIVLPLYQEDFDGDIATYASRKAKDIHRKFPAPWVVKTYTEDENMGIHLAKTFPELVRAIEDGVHHGKSILVEEFISGKVSSVHSVGGYRGDDVYVFPPANFSAGFNREEKQTLIRAAKDLHSHLGVKHYLRSDFVVHPKKGIFLTGLSLHPHLKPGSPLDQACESVGAKMHHVVEHILERALK